MNTRCLETLNLGHNSLTTEGIHRLKDGLLQNKSLLRIGLQAAKISCEGWLLQQVGDSRVYIDFQLQGPWLLPSSLLKVLDWFAWT
jgi:hypothetical protein